MARVRLTVPCPYCSAALYLDVEQATGRAWRELGKLKCSECDSKLAISLKVNRAGAGKRWKVKQERDRANLAAKRAEAELYNAAVLENWKQLEGCTCVADGSYSTSITNGIPNPPQHASWCPHNPRQKAKAV